jgi:hypothetical protein
MLSAANNSGRPLSNTTRPPTAGTVNTINFYSQVQDNYSRPKAADNSNPLENY